MRKMIRSGAIGEVVHMNSHFGYDLSGPFGASVLLDSDHWVHRLPAKLIHNVGDHIFNKLAEFLLDDQRVIETQVWPSDVALAGDRLPTEMRVFLKEGPRTATAIFSSAMRPVLHRFEVFGTKASLSLDFVSGTLCAYEPPPIRGVIGSLWTGYSDAWKRFAYANKNALRLTKGQFGHFSGLQFLFRCFYQSVTQHLPPPIPYDLILKVSNLIDRVLLYPRITACTPQWIA